MKLKLKPIVLSFLLLCYGTQEAHAFGSKAPPATTPPSSGGSNTGGGVDAGNTIIDLGLNFAIIYAKQDPRYSTILVALGINSAQDVRNFIQGNQNGTNFGNIISRLAFAAALRNNQGREILNRLGITNELQLREFINAQNGGFDFETLLSLALTQASSDSKYSRWLSAMGINDVQDIRNLLQGGKGGNIQSLIVTVGLYLVSNNPKLEKYVPYIQAAMMTLGLTQGMDGTGMNGGSDDDIINLGAFNGMTVGETKAIQYLN